MKNALTLTIGIAVLVILLVYMITFQVRYDQVAVLSTFDKAEANDLKNEPGLYFKAPWPIQKVYTYSKQINLIEDVKEEIQTADGYSVIVKLYLAWRIDEPYAFFRTLSNEENARINHLTPPLRQLKGVISQYRFDQLVNTDAGKIKLREIEQVMADQLRAQLAGTGYGIAVEQVGISRVILPEATTEKVFERMRKTRERMAERARAEGRAEAATIESDANSARDRILAFAERRAQAIRAEGDAEATQYFAQFAQDQEFATFLAKLEALRKTLSHNTTFIMDASTLWFLSPLSRQPDQAGSPQADRAAQR